MADEEHRHGLFGPRRTRRRTGCFKGRLGAIRLRADIEVVPALAGPWPAFPTTASIRTGWPWRLDGAMSVRFRAKTLSARPWLIQILASAPSRSVWATPHARMTAASSRWSGTPRAKVRRLRAARRGSIGAPRTAQGQAL